MTRSQALLAAVRREIDRRQALTDLAPGLTQITITVKFTAETGHVRGTIWQEEAIDARRVP